MGLHLAFIFVFIVNDHFNIYIFPDIAAPYNWYGDSYICPDSNVTVSDAAVILRALHIQEITV